MPEIYAGIRDASLRDAVVGLLRRLAAGALVVAIDVDAAIANTVLVTSPADCTPGRCAELAQEGVRTIVLAPLPTAEQAESYRQASAFAYLPMSLDHRALADAIAAANTEFVPCDLILM